MPSPRKRRKHRNRRSRGFTLIEMMITCAVIAILAVIAIPAFFSQSRKSKASSETNAMFAELSTREEQYKVDNGVYYGSGSSTSANSITCPSAPSTTGQSITSCYNGTTTAWGPIHAVPPDSTAYCSYTISVGPSSATPTFPTGITSMTSDGTNPTPVSAWYQIYAICDMDGNSTKNSTYFMSSMDTKIQTVNPGY